MKNLKELLLLLSVPIITSIAPEKNPNENLSLKKIESYIPKLSEIKYIRDSVVHNVKDYWQTIQETDSLKTGDCEDKSIYFYNQITKDGYNPLLVFGKLKATSKVSHIWAEISTKNKRYYIECTGKGKIIDTDTLKKDKYIDKANYLVRDGVREKIKEFEKRSGMKLNFKNFEQPSK